MKVYLKPGEKISMLTIDARVGLTGTTADIAIDWNKHQIKRINGDDGIGHILRDDIEGYDGKLIHFGVHVEDESGRLYFDTEWGE